MNRAIALTTLIAGGVASMWVGVPAQSPDPTQLPTLSYITTAHQFGVVGYRDPVGAISPDGRHFAYAEGRFVRVMPIGGGAPLTLAPGEGQIRFLAWTGNSQIAVQDVTPSGRMWLYELGKPGRQRLADDWRLPPAKLPRLDRPAVGPTALSPDGSTIYFSTPNENGMVELRAATVATGQSRRLSNFSRDAYAPSVAEDGTVVFKTQTYRTHLADVAFGPGEAKSASSVIAGGATRQLTTFQSETPSYHPATPLIAFTYGTWRRVVDDAKYPDIAQDIGIIDINRPLPHAAPSAVLEDSDSEDQAMSWSPNGKWIAFHSHKQMSDDVWLRPAEAASKADDKRITFLGRGAEVGWPRWSPDGRTVLLNGARKSDGASVLYAIGVDQDTGAVTSELREITVEGLDAEMGHAEWTPDSASVIALAKAGPGKHVIFTVPVSGGRAAVVHRVDSEHDFPGLGVSRDGKYVAFVAPANDGFFQIFVKTVGAKTPPVQLTTDRSHKTQPAFSPDGRRVAFTVWSYEAAFWSLKEP
jgi:Tol biopolymer transport system component